MLKKWLLLGSTAAAALALNAVPAFAEQTPKSVDLYYVSMHFTFDGKEYAPSSNGRGFIFDDTTYVPLRFVSYSLNKAVDWNQDTYTVTVREPSATEMVGINEYKLNAEVRDKGPLHGPDKIEPTPTEAYFETVHYVFDDKTVTPPEDKPGIIMDGTLYVPIRFYSESVGKTIDWDQSTYTVAATTVPEKKDEQTKPDDSKQQQQQQQQQTGGTPAPVVAAPVPSVPVPSGSAPSSPSVPSKSDLENQAKSDLTALENEANDYFTSLYLKYFLDSNHAAPATKEKYKSMGVSAMAGYDSRFNTIISNLQSRLESYHYSTEIITSLQDEYKAAKLSGINKLPAEYQEKAKAILGL